MWWKILLTIAEEMEEPWHETISRLSVFIDKIDMSFSKVGKDFGCGFYMSPDRGTGQGNGFDPDQREGNEYDAGP